MCVCWCMYVYVVHVWLCMFLVFHVLYVCVYASMQIYVLYAPLIGDACDAHMCIWCMFVYLCTHVFVVHVVHVCVHGASMHKCVFGGACMCIRHTYIHL